MDKLEEIFQRQAVYLSSLSPIYKENGFTLHASPPPWDINGRRDQEEYRLLAWRFTEEIIEAFQASYHCREPSPTQDAHFREELSDAFHFFIELCIVSGVLRNELLTGMPLCVWVDEGDSLEQFFHQTIRSNNDFIDPDESPFFEVLRATGLVMAELRQRPWRRDYRPTDRRKWVMGLHITFRAFVLLCHSYHVDAQGLHRAYFAKSEVNKQRNLEQQSHGTN